MDALERGVIVVGGASMGALRAAELDSLGMIGKGEIYRLYKDGIIESDDDVAIVFDPMSNEQLSEALVSMAHNFRNACQKGIISQEDYETLYRAAKNIYYPKRNYPLVFRNSGLDEEKINVLKEFLTLEGKDIKHSDALEVINFIKSIQDEV
jgi:hypothetical protein